MNFVVLFLISNLAFGQSHKVLLTTGYRGNTDIHYTNYSEVIDLQNADSKCEDLEEYPLLLNGASGGLFLDSIPIICGGGSTFTVSDQCYILGQDEPLIKMSQARSFGSAVMLNSSSMFITGGTISLENYEKTDFVIVQKSREIEAKIVPGPDLPTSKVYGNCITKIDHERILITGGLTSSGPNEYASDETYILNIDNGQWSRGPKMNHPRGYHGCTKIYDHSKQTDIFVVVGGSTGQDYVNLKSVEFLDASLTEWIEGPELPIPLEGFNLLSDEGGVYAFGGYSHAFSDKIFHMQCDLKCQWIEMRQKLKHPRDFMVGMFISDDLSNCHNNELINQTS